MRTYRDYLEIYTSQHFGTNSESELDDCDFFEQLAPEVETHWGATQVCIIDPDLKDVIKIFFNGEFEDVYNYKNDDYDVEFTEFHHDYANIAETIYKDAKELGFGDFFAAFEKIGETDGSRRPVFRQEYVTPLEDGGDSHPSKKAIDIVVKKQNIHNDDEDDNDFDEIAYMERAKWRTFDTNWTAAAIDAYGYELVERFLSFVRETSIHLDMHSGNYGYRKDGTPCILDWAGYSESW